MKTVQGNFLLQSSQSFPHDCELYDSMQNMQFLAHIIGNIAGDKAILWGCGKKGSKRDPGFVFLRTEAHKEGEVLWFEGGTETAGMYIKHEDEMVSAQNIDYKSAYTSHWLAEGPGKGLLNWADFTDLTTIPELKKEIEKNRVEIAALTPPPLGIVQVWAGSGLPSGYAMCDGAQLSQKEYPDLYKAIGSTFNNAVDYQNKRLSTSAGHFRLPDLRGRFIVGESSVENEYKTKGSAGGEKMHALSIAEMPSHTHSYWTWERGSDDHNRFSGNKNNDSRDKWQHESSATGNGIAHENRPPYYTLAYIMRLK